MGEVSHARSRGVSLFGLILQLVVTASLFVLAVLTRSHALFELAWFTLGGVPLWLCLLLVFRQRELADLEQMDIEELRREKAATGQESVFAGDAGLGFMVARRRLDWMLKYLVPVFGLLIGAYLLIMGLWRWLSLPKLFDETPAQLIKPQLGLILLSVIMLAMFFAARYAAGMARVAPWQMLRAGGSYLLGNTLVALSALIGFGVAMYQGSLWWHAVTAYATPVIMVLVGLETLVNVVADFYRPRVAGVEPRAGFDSRLLGVFGESGGLAGSIAEAINYQFGFRVSQTWFYQLLQRTLVPLVGVGVAALWLLSTVVVVQPYERAIIERFGRQVNVDRPLEPGVYLKWPAPIDRAAKYNVNQLQQFTVGFQVGDQPSKRPGPESTPGVEQWTDIEHGAKHFEFIVAPPPPRGDGAQAPSQPASAAARATPAGDAPPPTQLMRLELVVQYRIDPARLGDYARQAQEPDDLLRNIAWNETIRWCATHYVDALLGDRQSEFAELLRERMAARVAELRLGLELVHVGIRNLHPEKAVAENFRKVITAKQERVTEIRRALVTENEILSRVAGSKVRAQALASAISRVNATYQTLSRVERTLRDARPPVAPETRKRVQELRAAFDALVRAEAESDRAALEFQNIVDELELGLGRSLRLRDELDAVAREAAARLEEARQALAAAWKPVADGLARSHGIDVIEALHAEALTRSAQEFWTARLEEALVGLEGESAVTLARAQSTRWEFEARASAEVARIANERAAYQSAPEIYRARKYLDVLTRGLKDARKFFLAFDPGEREVRLRIEAQDQARPDLMQIEGKIQK